MNYYLNDIVEYAPLPRIREPPYVLPQILISPFSYLDMGEISSSFSEGAVSELFGSSDWAILPRASAGLRLLREMIGIKRISILTSFNTHYISGCVLQAFNEVDIRREFDPTSDAVMIIHEWGKRYNRIEEIAQLCRKESIPLIEDCALTIRKDIGSYGDYALYSFPKVFAMQYGGLLRGASQKELNVEYQDHLAQGTKLDMIKGQLAGQMKDIRTIFRKRRENWHHLDEVFQKAGFKPYFTLEDEDSPYIYMLCTDRSEELRDVALKFGIEAGVYWKNDALFLPCHQNLDRCHLDYIAGTILGNIDKCSRNRQ